jgi:hypothetical protein
MNPISTQAIQDFLSLTNVQIPVLTFIINLLIAAVLSFILSKIYTKFADSLSNRELFGRNFLLITLTTVLIISIIKSSLALSLGLVGALSIVRFRAAIKEPEELGYLFLAIGIGLGLGAGQTVITSVAFIIITSIIIIRKKYFYKDRGSQNLNFTIFSHNPHKIELEKVIEKLTKHCSAIDLQRFDVSKESFEACFLLEFNDIEQINKAKYDLQKLDDSLQITFLDNRKIF